MCLYPKMIENPRYKINKKNKGNIPILADSRLLHVPIGCGRCIECRKNKAREWAARLSEDIRENTNGIFVTLTFSDESYKELLNELEIVPESLYKQDNAVAALAVRRFCERWRKKYGKSVRHWLVTELGGTKTERIHIHGLIWTDEKQMIRNKWDYGWVWLGDYVSERTINYIVKYLNKVDAKHKNYTPKMMTSSGIGKAYLSRADSKRNKYNKETGKTFEGYVMRSGFVKKLPQYYRNKIYDEDEKEILRMEKLDLPFKYVLGTKVTKENYEQAVLQARVKNHKLGYGSDKVTEEDLQYEKDLRHLRTTMLMNKNKSWVERPQEYKDLRKKMKKNR